MTHYGVHVNSVVAFTRNRTLRFLTRNPHPVEGRGGRRWSGLQRVVSDFGRGPSAQAPGRRPPTLRWHRGLTCSDTSPRRPRTANPGEKTSLVVPRWSGRVPL